MKILIKLCFVCLLTVMANVNAKAQLYSVTPTVELVSSSHIEECYSITVKTSVPVHSIRILTTGTTCYNTKVCRATLCFDRGNQTDTRIISCNTKLNPSSPALYDGCIITIGPH